MELLEAIEGIFQILGIFFEGCLGTFEVVGFIADVVAAVKSRANRRARREARRGGQLPPPRTAWTVAFEVLTVLLLLSWAATVVALLLR